MLETPRGNYTETGMLEELQAVSTFWVFPARTPGFPGGPAVKNRPANAGDTGDTGFIPGLGKAPGEGNSNPFQYSCLGDPMDRRDWRATVQGGAKSQTEHMCTKPRHHAQVKKHLGDPGSSHHLRAALWEILIRNYAGRLLPNSKFRQRINDCGCFKPPGFGVTSAARKMIHRRQLWRASPVLAVCHLSFHPILLVISHEYWSQQHLLKPLCRKINSEFVFQGTQSWKFMVLFRFFFLTFFFFFTTPHGLWDLSCLTKDQSVPPAADAQSLTTRLPGKPLGSFTHGSQKQRKPPKQSINRRLNKQIMVCSYNRILIV